jgi:mRNA-degrading endonuclease RelE of RelBE toxin-antitoxin system
MAFEIVIHNDALEDLAQLTKFRQRQITGALERQLVDQPASSSRNRKRLDSVEAGFEFEPPLWELRVGEYRVFYDVDQDGGKVHVRAIRHKPPERRTEDIIR